MLLFFFFKQKTAYEMRISDWSSDVCSSDLYAKVKESSGNLAPPLLGEEVGGGAGTTGGAILLALIAAVAFATILAVVAGLTLTSSASVAHDLYNSVGKKGKATEKEELKVARIAAGCIGLVAIILAIPAQNLNIAFLVALAFAIAASANLPAIIYNMFWRRLDRKSTRLNSSP